MFPKTTMKLLCAAKAVTWSNPEGQYSSVLREPVPKSVQFSPSNNPLQKTTVGALSKSEHHRRPNAAWHSLGYEVPLGNSAHSCSATVDTMGSKTRGT